MYMIQRLKINNWDKIYFFYNLELQKQIIYAKRMFLHIFFCSC